MFVEGYIGVEGVEVFDAADMVLVPVRDEGVGDGAVFGGDNGGDSFSPGGAAFTCIEEYTLGAGA